jgi:hypothetical protein
MIRVSVALLVVVVAASPRAGGEEPLPRAGELELVAERAVVFKDGFAMVQKRARGVADAVGEVFTEEVPDAAVLGTFWALPRAGGPRLASMAAGVVTSRRTTKVETSPSRIADVLAWNVEEEARLLLDDGSTAMGTVRQVLAGSELVVLQNEAGSVVLPLSRVRRVDMKTMNLRKEQLVSSETQAKRLTFRFDGGAGERVLSLLYFRPGIRWIPTYRVTLPADENAAEARLSLQAEILNEAEDLVDVPLDLVVGVPNFRFGEVVSPFVLEPVLHHALRRTAPQLMGQTALSNASFRSRAGERRGGEAYEGAAAGGAVDLPPELTASGTQDLFVYTLPKTTILRGHRVAVPIFEATAPLRHVYTWDVEAARENTDAARPREQGASPLLLSEQRVWHQLEMDNGTTVPWTTGAALVLREGLPLGQDLLTYTPRGARTRLPLTVAVDVRGDYDEQETGRTLDALRWSNHAYARIDRRGTLVVANHKDVAVDVEVTLRVGGKATETSEGGSVDVQPFRGADWRNYRGDPAVNASSLVRYRLHLGPRERKEAWAAFHYFVPQ